MGIVINKIDAYLEALQYEIDALKELYSHADKTIEDAISLLYSCQGNVVCVGMGKCGIIAQKMVSTFVSTGTPSVYMHPAEALHGDLGYLSSDDVVVLLSNSGETPEIIALLPHIVSLKVPIIAMCGRPESTLAKLSQVLLNTGVSREADPLDMAPTASTTAMLAAGDALAAVLMKLRNFKKTDYAHYHPGGILGAKLLCKVDELMHTGNAIPVVNDTILLRDALVEMSSKRLGALFVLDGASLLVGVFTDGDLRRLFQSNLHPLECAMCEIMTRQPKFISSGTLADTALRYMEDNLITVLPVVNEQHEVVGALHIHDLIRAGIK